MAMPHEYLEHQNLRLRRSSPSPDEKLTAFSKEQLRRKLLSSDYDARVLLRILDKEKSNYARFIKQVVYFVFKDHADANVFFEQSTRTYEKAYRQMYVDFVSHKAGKKFLEGILGIELTDEQYSRIAQQLH